MTDPVFGELNYGYGWEGRLELDLFGKKVQAGLIINTSYEAEKPIQASQYQTFLTFLDKWPQLQEPVVRELIRWYNEEHRFSCGPDDPEEFAAWWPEIETVEEMLKWVELESVVVASDSIIQSVYGGKRCIYLLFNYMWAEDVNDYGIGIRLLNEEIDETRYKDIAF